MHIRRSTYQDLTAVRGLARGILKSYASPTAELLSGLKTSVGSDRVVVACNKDDKPLGFVYSGLRDGVLVVRAVAAGSTDGEIMANKLLSSVVESNTDKTIQISGLLPDCLSSSLGSLGFTDNKKSPEHSLPGDIKHISHLMPLRVTSSLSESGVQDMVSFLEEFEANPSVDDSQVVLNLISKLKQEYGTLSNTPVDKLSDVYEAAYRASYEMKKGPQEKHKPVTAADESEIDQREYEYDMEAMGLNPEAIHSEKPNVYSLMFPGYQIVIGIPGKVIWNVPTVYDRDVTGYVYIRTPDGALRQNDTERKVLENKPHIIKQWLDEIKAKYSKEVLKTQAAVEEESSTPSYALKEYAQQFVDEWRKSGQGMDKVKFFEAWLETLGTKVLPEDYERLRDMVERLTNTRLASVGDSSLTEDVLKDGTRLANYVINDEKLYLVIQEYIDGQRQIGETTLPDILEGVIDRISYYLADMFPQYEDGWPTKIETAIYAAAEQVVEYYNEQLRNSKEVG